MNFETVRKAVEFERTDAALSAFRRAGHIVSLKEVTKIVGRDIGTDRVQFHLIRSMQEDHRAGRPFAASVVTGNNNLPPEEYFRTAQQLGYNVGDRYQFWQSQLQRLGINSNQTRNQNQNNQRQTSGQNRNQNQTQGQGQGRSKKNRSGRQGQSQGQNLRGIISDVNSWYGSSDPSTTRNRQNNRENSLTN